MKRGRRMAVQRDQPYTGQNFLVDLGDGDPQGPTAAFSEVSGLDTWIEVAEYREGSDRDSSPSKVTSLNKVADVTLKRGIIGALNLYQWFDAVRNGDRGAIRTVTITLLSEDRNPVMTWKLRRARPVRYRVGPLNAGACDVAIEELVLAYERLEME
jgi:phage tail-like protein